MGMDGGPDNSCISGVQRQSSRSNTMMDGKAVAGLRPWGFASFASDDSVAEHEARWKGMPPLLLPLPISNGRDGWQETRRNADAKLMTYRNNDLDIIDPRKMACMKSLVFSPFCNVSFIHRN